VTRVRQARTRLATEPVIDVETAHGRYLARERSGRPVVHQRLCPHRGGPMGEAYAVGGLLVCSWHRSVFESGAGTRLYGPAQCGIRTLTAYFDGDDLVVDDGA
jgi:nitrite reductase/ring-hydroxylating ferredoxin subunit